jgi:hypothetical protein
MNPILKILLILSKKLFVFFVGFVVPTFEVIVRG